ncbi:MAG TPA: hypothetical protein VE078_18905, partial [Thermoanaerobaculia bacterium]|nr:hypothetical protein [Thermoanaerobaculia bacterium]
MLWRGATLLQKVERALEAELDARDGRTKPPQHAVAKPEGHWKRKQGEREKGAQCDKRSGAGDPYSCERGSGSDVLVSNLPGVSRQGHVSVARLQRNDRGRDSRRAGEHERALAAPQRGGRPAEGCLHSPNRLPGDAAGLLPLYAEQLVLLDPAEQGLLHAVG